MEDKYLLIISDSYTSPGYEDVLSNNREDIERDLVEVAKRNNIPLKGDWVGRLVEAGYVQILKNPTFVDLTSSWSEDIAKGVKLDEEGYPMAE